MTTITGTYRMAPTTDRRGLMTLRHKLRCHRVYRTYGRKLVFNIMCVTLVLLDRGIHPAQR